jgi:hypothetical protein
LEKDHTIPEVLRRRANMAAQSVNSAAAADYAGRNGGNKIILYEGGAPVENSPASMLENDMVWLRNALQRLLRGLGLPIGTTKT